jgi:hypothetical protein
MDTPTGGGPLYRDGPQTFKGPSVYLKDRLQWNQNWLKTFKPHVMFKSMWLLAYLLLSDIYVCYEWHNHYSYLVTLDREFDMKHFKF